MNSSKKALASLGLAMSMLLSACTQAPVAGENAPATGPVSDTEQAAEADLKIASLSIHLTNDLLALDVTPVGSVMGGKARDFLEHVKDRLQQTEKIGVAADPDMEAILALKPDMIVADNEFAGQDLQKYERIAPTHLFDLNDGTWRDHLRDIAKLVQREEQAEQFIHDYEAQKEEVKRLIHAEIGDGKVMAIRIAAKELRVFGMRRPMGPLLFEDLALQPANGVENIDAAYEKISQEVLPDFDADAIFVVVNQEEEAQKVFAELQDNPIWQGLKAVKANHVYVIKEQPWLDYSALGNKMALDEAEAMFGK